MSGPRVSVLMPLWRPDLRFLRAAIDSVRAQTVADWELLLVQDVDRSGSTGGVDDLVAAYADERIRHHIRDSRSSLSDALNDGLRLARARYVARLDSDDVCVPERLELQLRRLDESLELAVVGSSLTVINEAGTVIGHRRMPVAAADVARAMRRYNAVAHPSVMFRRDVVLEAGGYARGVVPEDYDLWCRLVKRGATIENCPEELVRYRYHAGASKFEAVHDVIRRTIATKMRYFSDELTIGDRLRIAGEYALLALPPRLVLRLFRMVTYR